ncbi:MAG: hypothetical protein IKX23_10105 [Treponema sp.]|nr:hypothetical protein [Treponema sp.]
MRKLLKISVFITAIVFSFVLSACSNGSSSVEKPALAGKTYKITSYIWYYSYYEDNVCDYNSTCRKELVSENTVTVDYKADDEDYFWTITRTGAGNSFEYTAVVDHYSEYVDNSIMQGWWDRTAEKQSDFDRFPSQAENEFNNTYNIRNSFGNITFLDETNFQLWQETSGKFVYGTYETNKAGTEIILTILDESKKFIYSKKNGTMDYTFTEDDRDASGTGSVIMDIYRFSEF